MNFKTLLAAGAAVSALSTVAVAQDITGAIRGTVTDEAGSPLSGANVSITDTQTGQTRRFTTDDSGSFSARNLSVSGSYTVTASASGYQPEQTEGLRLSLGNTQTLTFDLASGTTDEIVVVGTRQIVDVATGPAAVFNLETLESTPAINRDIKDVVRIDPRLYLDESNVDAIQCAGANPRYNSLTVDGIRLNDNFGLNSNGYPTERIPFSYDSIEQVSVELAPFDVEYGGFTACNINAVSKSGQNEFFGSAFADYTADELQGDKAGDRDIDNGNYDEWRYGVSVGGPVIPDTLFFFASYEKLEGQDLFGNNTPTGKGITDAQFQEIVDIAQSVYGYTVSDLPSVLANKDEKFLGKLDWNINDDHRASFTYNYNEGFSNSPSDGDPDELPEFNHFYKRGATLNSYVGSLYSNWTDRLSTEFRVSYIDLENLQQSYGADTGFGEVQIAVPGGDGGRTTVYLGEDDSRQSNELNYELLTLKAKADYEVGNHIITIGAEREEFDVFNLFVQETGGEFRFDSVEDFRNGDLNRIIYENAAGTNNPDDGAAKFGYEITTAYLQDVWQATTDLQITAGVRWDYYTSDDRPNYNPLFQGQYGIRNDDNLEGKGLVQPRVAFNWDAGANVSVRGGVGLFSGGNPNVWISNNYSNNGVTLYEFQERGTNILTDYTYSGGGQPIFDIPDEALAEVAAAQGGGPVNALDPNFDLPAEWKYALGATINFDTSPRFLGEGMRLDLDALYSKTKEAAIVKPLAYIEDIARGDASVAPDGRPIYPGGAGDFVLTNTDDKGDALVLSASLSAGYDFGLDWSLGYAYTDATDVNPMTSSVASSNFSSYDTSDAVFPRAYTSDYEIPHRFTMRLDYAHDFVPNYETRFSLFGQAFEGSPFSYVFGNNAFETGGLVFPDDRQLLYVPISAGDPLVASAPQEFYEFVANNEDLRKHVGGIAPRNGFNNDWSTKFDLRVEQQFPGVLEGHAASAFVILENVGNFLDSDWGQQTTYGFPEDAPIVDAEIVNGQYVYTNFQEPGTSTVLNSSLWSIRLGVRYEF
ncbi:TonB-dependent receptor [Parvularcula dongshanensis]|uniref:Outer membrane receptor for ferrienterochelin and colicin n=1 Tax=Parvularcula dongshanensis TaxID=1173995 RepID=A0A840HY76_9PROT|nr:TonB-dependent receptor [Parvularcula dongshanensis]MBB4657806.1 outer membrane receptor for ferrienterochelin and colicin [Parvularcula dongshanensis]